MTTKKTSDELLKEWHIVRKEERRIKKCKKFCRRQAVKEVLLDEKKPKEKIKKDCANLIKTLNGRTDAESVNEMIDKMFKGKDRTKTLDELLR